MYIRLFSCINDLVHIGNARIVPVRDVLADSSVEKNRLLLHEADCLTSVCEYQLVKRDTVLGL